MLTGILNKPANIDKGQDNFITLDRDALLADIIANKDSYFHQLSRWTQVLITYESDSGNQLNHLEFNPQDGAFPVANFNPSSTARNVWEVQMVMVRDLDNGEVIYCREELDTADFDITITSADVQSVNIQSNNVDQTIAVQGDVVTVDIQAQDDMFNVQATISGLPSVVSGSGDSRSISRTMTGAESQGNVTFSITYEDSNTNSYGPITSTTDSSTVDFDSIAPTLSTVTIYSNNADTTKAVTGDIITIDMVSSLEPIQNVTATILGQAATMSGSSQNWTAQYTVQASDNGIVDFTIDFEDEHENQGIQVTSVTDSSEVTVINMNPAIDSTFLTNIGTGFDTWPEGIETLSDGDYLIYGSFTQFNGSPVSGLVKIDHNGILDSTFMTNIGTGPNGMFHAKQTTIGIVLVGPTLFNGTTCGGVYCINTSGLPSGGSFNSNTLPGFDQGDINYVDQLPNNNLIFSGGSNTHFNGQSFSSACILSISGTLISYIPSGWTYPTRAMASVSGNVILTPTNNSSGLYERDPNFNILNTYMPAGNVLGPNGSAMEVIRDSSGSFIYVGAYVEDQQQSTPIYGVIKLKQDGEPDLNGTFTPIIVAGGGPNTTAYQTVTSMSNGDLIIGTGSANLAVPNINKVSNSVASGGSPLPFTHDMGVGFRRTSGTGAPGHKGIANYNNTHVIAVGAFELFDGTPVPYIVKLEV